MKPAIVGGAVTVNNPHPALTAGADGAAGKTTTLTVLLSQLLPPDVPAVIEPQAEVKVYLAFIVWHPKVDTATGVEVKVPPSILNSVVNPEIDGTEGRVKAEAHVLVGTANTGAVGKTMAFTVFAPQVALVELASIPPQSAVSLYLALIVQQPEVFVSSELAVANVP